MNNFNRYLRKPIKLPKNALKNTIKILTKLKKFLLKKIVNKKMTKLKNKLKIKLKNKLLLLEIFDIINIVTKTPKLPQIVVKIEIKSIGILKAIIQHAKTENIKIKIEINKTNEIKKNFNIFKITTYFLI